MSINSIRRYSSTWCHREKSWSQHQNLQEVWFGTQGISISLCPLTLFAGIPLLGGTGRNPGHGTKNLQEDWMGTQGISYYFIKSMSLLKPGATRCHGTRIARGGGNFYYQ